MIELVAGDVRCSVSPPDGARIAGLRVGGTPLIVEHGVESSPMSWGCYPMVPFAGRIRDGRFTFAGREHQLPLNMPPHAIHGYGYTAPWEMTDLAERRVEMRVALGSPWPFGGSVVHAVDVDEDSVTCTLTITAGDEAMPAQVGWHPWFLKPRHADLRFAQMYRRDAAGIPDGTLVEPPPGPWDDCFVEPLAPLRLLYDRVELVVESDCEHVVVYDQTAGATCVEPQSGPPNGFNSADPSAATVLQPGTRLTRWMRIRVV